jgi:hypothetical protein
MDAFKTFDFHRIFFGDLPYGFLLEIVFPTAVMYGYTIILLRLLGNRSMGQLSNLKLAIIICFRSAVGDPMMDNLSDCPKCGGSDRRRSVER